jgi:hypothetical protein
MVEAQPSGVRVRFRTRATAIELDALATRRVFAGLPPRPQGVYDLLVDGCLTGQGSVPGGNTLTIDMRTGTADFQAGPTGTVTFTGLPDTDRSSPPPVVDRCGFTTAVRSARARTPRARPPPGRRSPPRTVVWS